MELSRRRVPLYGQAKVFALLEGYDSVPEDAEVYIVLEGSTLVHVTRAQSDVMLCFIVPGHNLAEVVSVQAYLSSGTALVTWVGGASLEYVQDDAQDLAEHLVMHAHCLSSKDHTELSSLFNLGQESSRGAMDRRVALAVANLDIPRSWNVLGSHGGDERTPRESPLHLAVRWGLFRLAELLLCQPGGLMAVSLPNQEGVTPLQLAQTAANTEILELLAHPPNPLATPPAGLSQVWADRSRLLRFCHDSGNLTLTVRQNLRWSSEESRHADILLLRERLRDQDFLREIKALRREHRETVSGKERPVDDARDNALHSDINRAALGETDREEPLMFCLNEEDEDEEKDDPSLFDSGQTQSTRESQAQSPTLAAAVRLSAMIHGKGRVFANAMLVDQVDGADIKYRSPGEEEEEEDEVSPAPSLGRPCSFSTTPPASRNHAQDRHPPSPRGGEKGIRGPEIRKEPSCRTSPPSTFTSPSSFPSSPLVSAFRLYEGGQRRPCLPVSPALNRRGYSLTEASQGLSPSLEGDSGEEDILGHSYPSSSVKKQSIPRSSSREERDSFEASPDFNRLHSPPKSPEEAEVRLRSYSFSSPKAKPSRPLLNRDTTVADQAEEQRAFSLTETTKEKRIEDEEWDKYIIPSKVESEKYKVSRTFSFLKSRMSSTRNKTKVKGKEAKEGKEKAGATNGHQFVSASPPSAALCVGCDRSVSGKELLQCSNCFLNVHKNCRESVAACGKKPQERNALLLKTKTMSLPHNSVKDNCPSTFCSSASLPTTTREKRETAGPLSKSFSVSIDSRRLSDAGGLGGEGAVTAWTNGALADEGSPAAATPTSTELPTATPDGVDAPLMSGLSAEELGLEVESWSLAVSPEFCRQHDRHTIKRQEVIYELMQTELHHIQTLTVMSGVFRRGMLEELQLDWDCVARIFPCLDPLLLFHKNLFGALLERRQAAAHTDTPGDYLIHQIGDILLQQFSDEYAEEMKQVYGEFCSHHTEAVNVFKELQQQNKKLQNFVKQQSNNTLVRRREVPEFILLVTQRITKYPVLLERILHYTREESQEHADLSRALAQIRNIIAAVDLTVNRHERCQELQEVLVRLENKSFAKLKNDKVFRKQDLHSQHRVLQYKGLVYWKTATGRLKDTLALLLTDVLVFLQEKDQRFVFAAVDQKPPVIPLQKLIVREVANEERGMFLISASSVGPEMYEVHTNTRDERNAWMRHIRQAVESCPEEEEEEERTAEIEESRRVAELRVQKISKFQEMLSGQDQLICNSLEEKLQLYAELTEFTLRSPEPVPHRHLVLADPDAETPRQASALLIAALREAENLISVLQSRDGLTVKSAGYPAQGPECCGYDSRGSSVHESPSEPDYLSTLSISSASPGSDGELAGLDGALWSPAVELSRGDAKGTLLKVAESVQNLTQLLYSLQAAVTVQDSCYEVQKLLLLEGERPQLHLEQEKQKSVDKKKEEVEKRGLERKKEEVDEVQKLHVKLKQVQQRWDKECLARDKRQCEQESVLEQREHRCLLEAERLRCEREELEAQLLEYQQNLERLKAGQRSVEREKEKIEAQQRLLQRWRHHRQSSLPMTIPLDGHKVSGHSRSGSLDGNLCVYENEATVLACLQQSHPPRRRPAGDNQQQHLLSAASGKNCAANLGLSASLYNSLNTLLSQAHGKPPADGPTCPRPLSGRVSTQQHVTHSDFSVPMERRSPDPWSSEVTGHRLYEDGYSTSPSLMPLLPPHAYLSLEGENGEEGCEENIVYL